MINFNDDLTKKIKNSPLYIDALKKVSAEEAKIIEKKLDEYQESIMAALTPFVLKINSDPEFFKGLQKELDIRNDELVIDDIKIINEKDGK